MNQYFEKFAQAARRRAEHPAIEVQRADGVETTSYSDLLALSERAAVKLAEQGLGAGDRCAILAHNSADWCAAYFGILRLGAIAVPLDTNYKASQVAEIIEDCQAPILLTAEKCSETSAEAAQSASHAVKVIPLRNTPDSLLQPSDANPRSDLPPCPAQPDHPAVMLYTSGTTSDPKGVVLTHGNLLIEVEIALAAIELDQDDRILGVLPLFHSLAQVANLLLPLGLGATVVYLETLNTAELLRALRDRRISTFCCVPQFFYLIHERITKQLSQAGRAKQKAFRLMLGLNGFLRDRFRLNLGRLLFGRVHDVIGRSMRFLITGGSRFEASIGRDFFCMGFNILQAYGLTECTGGATLTRVADGWTDSVGTPLPHVEVKIIPDPELATDAKTGEVALRGPNIMQGYYNRPDANAQVFADGWFLTGDLGHVDSAGRLHITGRKKEMIVLSSGKNIYPEEIEAHYRQASLIKELCVMGRTKPDEPTAERLHGVIVPDFEAMRERNIVNTREILRYEIENLSIHLPGHKRILSYEIRSEDLPRTTTRKLKRFAIEEEVRNHAATTGDAPATEREFTTEDTRWVERQDIAPILGAIRTAVRFEGALHPDANIELELGLDSMERVELLAHLEEVVRANVPEELTAGIYTVRELAEALLASKGDSGGKDSSGDTWSAMLAGSPESDAEWAAQLKLHAITSAVLFLVLKSFYFAGRMLFRFRAHGLQNLPASGPCLLCPNHQSYLDAFFLVCALPYSHFKRMFFVGATEYFETPLMARLARLANIVPVDPDSNLLRAMEAGAYGLRNDRILILFPEGERCIDGEVKKFKKGAAILSLNLGVPVVPVALNGLFDVWPRGKGFQGFYPVSMAIGVPIAAGETIESGMSKTEAEGRYLHAANALRDAVISMWQELRGATVS